MALIDLKIPAGVYKNGTAYQSKGRWADCDLVRWFEGTMRPVGGWTNIIGGIPRGNLQVTGSARGSFSWRANANDKYLAIGTHTNLFAYGTSISGLKDITPSPFTVGFVDNNVNMGYGGGPFGDGAYGTPRTSSNITQFATTWSFDNFGEFLVAVSSQDGRLLYWDLVANTAVPVTATAGTTPVMNKGVIVTDERFVMLLQAGGNRRRVAWSDQENLFNWQITATTQAGDFDLATSGDIQTAVKVRGQTLIITTEDAFTANYLGAPLVYGFERAGSGCGVISKNGAVQIDKAAIWMGSNDFFLFDGFVKPLPCEVSDYVFKRLNRSQMDKVFGVHNSDFGEVTFYYPAGMEVDSYVTFNYREGHWSVGSMDRTTAVDSVVFSYPIRVDSSGFLYEHEIGYTYDGRMPFVESGPVEIGSGDQVYMAKYLYPDELTQGDVRARFSTKFYPNAPDYKFGPYSMANPTSVRFTGRQVSMRIEGFANVDWRVGVPRLDVETGGLR